MIGFSGTPRALASGGSFLWFFCVVVLRKWASAKNGGILYGIPIFWQLNEPKPTHSFDDERSRSLRRLSARASFFDARTQKEPPRLTAQGFPAMVIFCGW